MSIESLAVTIVRWAARALALATFLLWGWFFSVQLEEWILYPFSLFMPLGALIGQSLYVLLLAGLVVGFKWELAGGLMVIGAAVPLFASNAPLFIPLAVLPGVLYIACWFSRQPGLSKRACLGPDDPARTLASAA